MGWYSTMRVPALFFLNKTEKKRKLLGSFNKNYDICAA